MTVKSLDNVPLRIKLFLSVLSFRVLKFRFSVLIRFIRRVYHFYDLLKCSQMPFQLFLLYAIWPLTIWLSEGAISSFIIQNKLLIENLNLKSKARE